MFWPDWVKSLDLPAGRLPELKLPSFKVPSSVAPDAATGDGASEKRGTENRNDANGDEASGNGAGVDPEQAERQGWVEVDAPEPDAGVDRLDPALASSPEGREALRLQLRTALLTSSEQLGNAFRLVGEARGVSRDPLRRAAFEALVESNSPEAAGHLVRLYESCEGERGSDADWVRDRVLGALAPEADLAQGRISRFMVGVLAREAGVDDSASRSRAESAAAALVARARLQGKSLDELIRAASVAGEARSVLEAAWRKVGTFSRSP